MTTEVDAGLKAAELDLETLIAQLASVEFTVSGRWPKNSGLYAAYIKEGFCLGEITVGPEGLLYVGVSKNLSRRNHSTFKNSAKSALRRTLGAIFRDEWGLVPRLRSYRSTVKDASKFRFRETDEDRISQWMKVALRFHLVQCPTEYRLVAEQRAIASLKPPLNDSSSIWSNPQAERLRKLREQCADEARSSTI